MFQPFKGTPADARTGLVIQFPYGGRKAFLVEAVRWANRETPQGFRLCVEFDGWSSFDRLPEEQPYLHVEAGCRHGADFKRYRGAFALAFTADTREMLLSPRALSGRADADQRQTELDDFLTSIGARA